MINISDSATKLNSLNRRMFILATAKIIILGGIVSRLFFLQVKENKKYLTLSDKNRIREWKLPPIRGEFQDYFGNTIAGNFEAYQLHIIPEEVEDFRYVIYRIKDLLELSDKEFKKSNIKLIIAGGYDKRVKENVDHFNELEEIAKKGNVLQYITWKRAFSDEEKPILLANACAILYTPTNEHFGIVPIECMASCKPVIACASGGPLESVANGKK